jgi:type 1 fimbria pilin
MKNRILKLAAVSAIVMGATAAHADAPSANLTVKGTITAPSCTVSMPAGGALDYGNISSALVKPGTETSTLIPLGATVTVTCDAQTNLTFSAIDNRAGTASAVGATNFGLGNVNGTGKIGYYTLSLSSATVDGTPSSVFTTAGTTFTASSSAPVTLGNKQGWAASDSSLMVGKVFAAQLAATATLAGSAEMGGPVSDTISLDGSTTLNFAFGL